MFFFCCLGGGAGPAQTAKEKKHAPAQTTQNQHAPGPSERVLLFAVWAGGCVSFFFLFGPGACFFVCCLGRGVFFVLLLERWRVFVFAVWAVGVFFFWLFGRGSCFFFCSLGWGVFFFAVWAGNGSSLTYRSAWLVFKQPNNKKDQTAKKRTRVPVSVYQAYLSLGSNGTPRNIISMVFTHILAFKQAPP